MSFANIISQSVAVMSWPTLVISCFLIIAISIAVRLFIFFNHAAIFFLKFMGLDRDFSVTQHISSLRLRSSQGIL